ncbi:MAG: hypothetical protein ACT4OV_11415 [Microthrixaceae bacterium]
MSVYELGVAVGSAPGSEPFRLEWGEVRELSALDNEGIRKRVTVTRVVLFGGLGLLAPKSTVSSYLHLVDQRGEWLFELTGISAMRLKAGIASVTARCHPEGLEPSAQPDGRSAGSSQIDAAQRLRGLENLREEGLLNEDEYQAKRAAIISEL